RVTKALVSVICRRIENDTEADAAYIHLSNRRRPAQRTPGADIRSLPRSSDIEYLLRQSRLAVCHSDRP
ncbi:MAG TPA: hypothetical protein VMW65_06070, partial [Chloroflexota bacterium]|nr:hypothetical protein [Chloroflexota bacterium]